MKRAIVRGAAAAALLVAGLSLGYGIPGIWAHDNDDDDDDDDDGGGNGARFAYAVKAVCENGGGGPPGVAQPTTLNVTTKINVHNPNTKAVTFAKKGIPLEDDQLPKPPGDRKSETLKPDWALQMGCEQIDALGARGPTGFGDVIIESPRELDVWAVYLTTTTEGTVADTDVVRVPATRIK